MLPATMFSIAHHANPPPKSSAEHMVCFGKDNGWDIDECYETRPPFTNIQGDGLLRVSGGLVQDDGQLPFGELQVDLGNPLFLRVYPGRLVYFSKSAMERKFQNPGILLFRKGVVPFEQVVTVRTERLTQTRRIEFAGLRGAPLSPGSSRARLGRKGRCRSDSPMHF